MCLTHSVQRLALSMFIVYTLWLFIVFNYFFSFCSPYSVVQKLWSNFPKICQHIFESPISRGPFESLSHEWHSQFSILNCIIHTRTHTLSHPTAFVWFSYEFCSTFRCQLIKFNGMLYFHSFNIQTWSHSFLNCLHCSHWSHWSHCLIAHHTWKIYDELA